MDWAGEQKCWPKGHWATKEQQGRPALLTGTNPSIFQPTPLMQVGLGSTHYCKTPFVLAFETEGQGNRTG